MFLRTLELFDHFLDFLRVKPLIVLPLRGELKFIGLLLALDVLLRDLELISILSMTPIDASLVGESFAGMCEDILETCFDFVDVGIATVEILIEACLGLRDLFLTGLCFLPDNHPLKAVYH